jgi:hypothetical protein
VSHFGPENATIPGQAQLAASRLHERGAAASERDVPRLRRELDVAASDEPDLRAFDRYT